MAQQAQAGELSAAELFREHGAFVARFLFRLGVPADAIQDAVQEVFLVVHQRGGYRPGPAKPTSYLALIASNAAAVHRRRARAGTARVDATEPDALSAHDPPPDHALETRDSLHRLQAALDKLDPDLRATLLLADGEDETCASIAEGMGVPVGTVYWRLHQARKRFQRALAAVDASWEGPRAAGHASARPRRAARVFVRSAKMLTILLGVGLPSWRGSQAHALLRDTAKQMPIPFDVQAELLRHTQAIARVVQPGPGVSLAPPAGPAALGGAPGALKTALLVTTGGAALVAALQWLPGDPGARSSEVAALERRVTAAPIAAPAAPQPQGAAEGLAGDLVHQGEDAASLTRERKPPEERRRSASPDPTVRGLVPDRGRGSLERTTANRAGRSAQTGLASSRGTEQTSSEKAPAPPRPEPSPEALPSVSIVEAQAIGRAEALLRTDPAQSLAIVRKVALQQQADYLAEERRYIEVMALHGLHERMEAQRAAAAFLVAYPQSVFRERVASVRK
jgi:RNA polymerase sigma-70 factor (ECF subfamily)